MTIYLFSKDNYSLMQVNNFSVEECEAHNFLSFGPAKFDEFLSMNGDKISALYWVRTLDTASAEG